MAMRNRVLPTGDIAAIALRGGWMGNRGCIHDGTEIVRPWRTRAWICCETEYRGWVAPRWEPGRWTALFFHDEAVALAAGHRPCALCRRPAYNAFVAAWVAGFGGARPRAPELDARLHQHRIADGGQRTHTAPWSTLADGTFVRLDDGAPALLWTQRLHPWSPMGYALDIARPRAGTATVLTPACTVEVLRAGYEPQVAVEA